MALSFDCERETFVVAVCIMDRYLAAQRLEVFAQLQLVAATSLYIASKTVSIDNTFIGIEDISMILGHSFDAETIKVLLT